MIPTLIVYLLSASGPGRCPAVPVARDLLLTRGDCAGPDQFSTGFLQLSKRRVPLVSASWNAPEANLALFTLESPLPRSVPIADVGPCDLAANPPIEFFRSAETSDFLFENKVLVGVRLTSGDYLRTSSVCAWLRLKLGGD